MLNQYFNNYSIGVINEQRLLEDLIIESINIMGHNIYYIPREGFNPTDDIFGENPQSKFERFYLMPLYIANVEGYEGDGDFFSKFGLEIRDTSNFVVARRTFEKYIPGNIVPRPREGDLIYVPVMRKLFEIKFVEEELLFFSIGRRNPYMYELRCELFRFSDENFDTGIGEIDEVETENSYTIELNLGNGTGLYQIGESVYQGANLVYATAKASVTNHDASTKKITLHNITGTFASATNLIGQTSNAVFTVISSDLLEDNVYYDQSDNKAFQTEASGFVDLSEQNPFGNP